MRVWIRSMAEQPNFSIGNWDRQVEKKKNMKKWKIIVNLYQVTLLGD